MKLPVLNPLCHALCVCAAVVAVHSTGFAASATVPKIEVYYGDEQRFGFQGNPQPRINILGVVSSHEAVETLTFTLNGGVAHRLNMGVDLRRLSRPGGFNAEIERKDLRDGENIVVLEAKSRAGGPVVRRTVRVRYAAGRTAPLPCTIKWSEARRIDDVAEVMDGHWQLTPDGVRTLDPYYDRVIAIGDTTWTDYEAVTSVIFHKFLADVIAPKGPPYSNHGHASVLLRWQGHPDDGNQPRVKWHPCGGLAMWRADAGTSGSEWVWQGGESGIIGREGKKRLLELGRRYLIRARVETLPGPKTRYSVKGWAAGEPEPTEWDLVALDREKDLQSGSFLLVAHHSDVTFGNVEIRPLR